MISRLGKLVNYAHKIICKQSRYCRHKHVNENINNVVGSKLYLPPSGPIEE